MRVATLIDSHQLSSSFDRALSGTFSAFKGKWGKKSHLKETPKQYIEV